MNDQYQLTLDDLLKESIIMSLMARDGVRAHEIRRLLKRVRDRSEQRAQRSPRGREGAARTVAAQ
jgi:hypothetical protein